MNGIIDAIAAAYDDIIATDKADNPRVEDGDWVRIARIRDLINEPHDAVTAALIEMTQTTNGMVQLAPESATMALLPEDHEAAVHWGSEALHLISIEADYFG